MTTKKIFIVLFSALVMISCTGKSQQNQERADKSSISVETFTADQVEKYIPKDHACWFSVDRQEYEKKNFIYADDYDGVAVMKIGGELIVFEIEVLADETIEGISADYTLTAIKDPVVDDDGNIELGYAYYDGNIKLTNRHTGAVVFEQKWYGNSYSSIEFDTYRRYRLLEDTD